MSTGVAPTPGYLAATTTVALFERDDLEYWTFTGRDPARMLSGVVSGRMPEAPEPAAGAVTLATGLATLHTVLTPKGRMVADLRLALESGAEDAPGWLWAVVPAAASGGLREHLKRYLPPRFAKIDVPEDVGILGLCGPEADARVADLVFDGRIDAAKLTALPRGGTVVASEAQLRLVRCSETTIPAYQIIGPATELASLSRRLESAGATPATASDWEVLRVEAGTPRYGVDMDEGTIPTEAGLEEIAIDHAKGCYTGQEVIVRIRDRGHVNRKLLQIGLGATAPPAAGTEVFVEGREKPAAVVTSSVRSPRFGETIALAYVRREVWTGEGDPPAFSLRS